MFPKIASTDDLEDLRRSGHFISKEKLTGDFHVRNPQLLPNIIGQKHLTRPDEWRGNPEEAFLLLMRLNNLLEKDENNEK